uniref:Putative tail protein n=1 Tax=viral metagenome TaxID=1070528 RepID=A0A6M3L1J2_9ZZZZ
MPVQSGVATDYLDLLNKVRSFVTSVGDLGAEAWTEKRWQNSNELILLGSGISGTEEIYVGVSGYFSVGSDYYNWRLNGFTGFDSGLAFNLQPGAMTDAVYPPVVPLWNSPMTYWLIANGRRIVLVSKVSTRFEAMYLGFITPYGTPGQYPYPNFVGGSMMGIGGHRWSYEASEHSHFAAPLGIGWASYIGPARLRKPSGDWASVANAGAGTSNCLAMFPYHYNGNGLCQKIRATVSGNYVLTPLQIYDNASAQYNIFGELDGVYFITGYQNGAENIVSVSGQDYLVVQNVYRTGPADYWAVRLV